MADGFHADGLFRYDETVIFAAICVSFEDIAEMSHHLSFAESFRSALYSFVLLLFALFTTEMGVMSLLDSVLPLFDPGTSALLDAFLLCLLLAWPFWFFSARNLDGGPDKNAAADWKTKFLLWGKVLGVVFVAEFTVMQVLRLLPVETSTMLRDFLDALLVCAFSAPFFWRLLFRPGVRRCRDSMTDLLGTPVGLYVLLLYLIFVADLLIERIVMNLFPDPFRVSYEVTDAIVTTLILAPLLWLFVARPLRRAMLSEHARSRTVLGQLIDPVIALDGQGEIVSFNPAAERIFGYGEAEIVGRKIDLLLGGDQENLAALLQRATGREERESSSPIYEVSGVCKDGSRVTLEVSLSRLEDRQGQEEYLLIMRDLTGRKLMENALRESRERFREIFEQSDDAILFLRLGTLQLLDANTTAEELFGRTRRELIENGLEGLMTAAAVKQVRMALGRLTPGEKVQFDLLDFRRADGSELIVSVRCKVMTVQNVDLLYVTFRDMTERVRLENESREIQAQLIHANKMTSLGLMVSGVAHEINNPNNLILANASLLARGFGDVRTILREYQRDNGEFHIGGIPFTEFDVHAPQLIAGIIDGSRRIDAIVTELKGFARREQGAGLKEVDINQVATTALSIVHHEMVKYTENFHLDMGAGLPAVLGSSQQLGQVIVNLLMNSCHALPDRSREIWLATAYDATRREVLISVRDTGCGMAPEISHRVMEPFFTTRIDSGGTGLGLSICQSIVKKHAGSLTFTTTPGVGTEFVVRLPAYERPTEKTLAETL